MKEAKGKVYPIIGLKKKEDHIMANFGQRPFMFNIDGYMTVRPLFFTGSPLITKQSPGLLPLQDPGKWSWHKGTSRRSSRKSSRRSCSRCSALLAGTALPRPCGYLLVQEHTGTPRSVPHPSSTREHHCITSPSRTSLFTALYAAPIYGLWSNGQLLERARSTILSKC